MLVVLRHKLRSNLQPVSDFICGGDGNAVDICAAVWYVVYLPKQKGDDRDETELHKKM